jgi:hypothetical protein
MNRLASIAAAVLALLAAQPPSAWPQLACMRSAADPRYLRWRSDPELVVLAGGDAAVYQRLTTTTREALWKHLRNLRGAGGSLTLDGHRLRAELDAHGVLQEETDYGRELAAFLGTPTPSVTPAELRIRADALHAMEPSPVRAAQKIAQALAPLLATHNGPLITFDRDCPGAAARTLREELRRRRIACAVGQETLLPADGGVQELDFAVVDPETFPAGFRDQAAIAWARSQLSEMPLVFDVQEARFYPEIFWLATGAAGIRYQRDAETLTPATQHELDQRRAACAVTGFFRFRPFSYAPPRDGDNVRAVFVSDSLPVRVALAPLAPTLRWQVELPEGAFNVYPFWYDSLTDVFVEQPPRRQQRGVAIMELAVPRSQRPYLFGIAWLASGEDRRTMLGPVTPLEGEIPDEETTDTAE